MSSDPKIFSAVGYLVDQGVSHNEINLQSVRCCGRTGRVILGWYP